MSDILNLIKSNGHLLSVVGGIVAYIFMKYKFGEVGSLKEELATAKEKNTDSTLAVEQSTLSTEIDKAKTVVPSPVLTPQEAIEKLDTI
jgi:hypothetical protein